MIDVEDVVNFFFFFSPLDNLIHATTRFFVYNLCAPLELYILPYVEL